MVSNGFHLSELGSNSLAVTAGTPLKMGVAQRLMATADATCNVKATLMRSVVGPAVLAFGHTTPQASPAYLRQQRLRSPHNLPRGLNPPKPLSLPRNLHPPGWPLHPDQSTPRLFFLSSTKAATQITLPMDAHSRTSSRTIVR